MAYKPMYPGLANSPETTLAAGINETAVTIPIVDIDDVPTAPNLVVLGTGEDAETVLYTGKVGNSITGCTRGFDGTTARAWDSGTVVARRFCAYDLEAVQSNALPTGTQGDLLYHNGTAWVVLNPDTAGQILQTGGPGANPAWADLPDGMYWNAIINGNFDIWQRGTSFTDSDVKKYTADRWRIYTSGDARLDVRRSTDVPENVGMYYSMEIELTNSNGGVLVGQIIETFPTLFKNKAVNLSFWVKKVSGDISTFIPMQHDTGFDPVILSTSWQRYSSSITMGSSPPPDTRIFRVPDTTGIVRITGVQLNLGDKPLPFAPRSYAEELALCQRYYRTWTQQTENGRIHIPLWPPMRVAPTMTASAGTISNITAAGFNLTHNAQAATTISASSEL